MNLRETLTKEYEAVQEEDRKKQEAREVSDKAAAIERLRLVIQKLNIDAQVEITSDRVEIDGLVLELASHHSSGYGGVTYGVRLVRVCPNCDEEDMSEILYSRWDLAMEVATGRYSAWHRDKDCLADLNAPVQQAPQPTKAEQLVNLIRDIAYEVGGCQCQH